MTDEELKRLIESNSAETRRHFDATAARITETTERSTVEIRRHFDVVAERLEKRFDLLAEADQFVNEGLQRTQTSLDEKIEKTAAETQAMIKFSHRELDRRVTALEETVADLETRLRRVETGTH